MLNDSINFWVDISNVYKSKTEDGKEMLFLEGIASTPDEDLDGEYLLPEGFETDYFMKSGMINWHHMASKMPAAVIGEPVAVKIIRKNKKSQLFVKSMLYNESAMAVQVYDLANVLSKNSKTRRLGYSIEGKVLERDLINPKIVKKLKLTGLAVTHMPVNTNTFVNVVKGVISEDVLEPKVIDEINVDGVTKSITFQIIKANGDLLQISKDGEIFLNGIITKSEEKIVMTKEDFIQEHKELVENIDGSTKKEKEIKEEQKEELEEVLDDKEKKSMNTQNSSAVMPESLEGNQKELNNSNKEVNKDCHMTDEMKKAMEVLGLSPESLSEVEKLKQAEKEKIEMKKAQEISEADKLEKSIKEQEAILAENRKKLDEIKNQTKTVEVANAEVIKSIIADEVSKALTPVIEEIKGMFKAHGELAVKALNEINSVKALTEIMMEENPGPKSVLNKSVEAVQRQFDNIEQIKKAQAAGKGELSLTRDKGAILKYMDTLAYKGQSIDPEYTEVADAIAGYEVSGVLPDKVAMILNKAYGIKIIS